MTIPYQQLHHLPSSPASSSIATVAPTYHHRRQHRQTSSKQVSFVLLDNPPSSATTAGYYLVPRRSGAGACDGYLQINHSSSSIGNTGLLVTSSCPAVDPFSPTRRRDSIEVQKKTKETSSRSSSDVVSLLFLNCAASLLDTNNHHKLVESNERSSRDAAAVAVERRAPYPPSIDSSKSSGGRPRFSSPKRRHPSATPPSIRSSSLYSTQLEQETVAVPVPASTQHFATRYYSSTASHNNNRANKLDTDVKSSRLATNTSPSFTASPPSYQKTIQKLGGTTTVANTIPSSPPFGLLDFEAENKLHVDRFYHTDFERSILLVEKQQHQRQSITTRPIIAAASPPPPPCKSSFSPSSPTSSSATTNTTSETTSSSSVSTRSSNSSNSSNDSSPTGSFFAPPLISILQQSGRSPQSKNTMRHISWQDQAAVKRAATASSVVSSTTSSSVLYVPSIVTSIAGTSSSNSDKENNHETKDTISRYTPRTSTTPTSSVATSSLSPTASKPQFILEPSDLWNGTVRFDPQQIQELFVEMCFFARLGFVQPPCCLQCTYRDCNDTSPTPTSHRHPQQPHRHVAGTCNNNNSSKNRSCQRWVVWRKDANTLLHPNLLDGNVLIVQCQAAQRLLAGEQVDGCYWDAQNKQVARAGLGATTKAANAAPASRPS